MGNLRRIRCSVGSLDPDIRETIQAYVDIQMAREVMYHEKRLEAILDENIDSAESYNLMTTDWILSRAISELQSAQKIPS